MAQLGKNWPAMWETWVWSLGWEGPLEEGMATHFSILAWRIPMNTGAWWATVHGHDWVTRHTCLYEGHDEGSPVSLSGPPAQCIAVQCRSSCAWHLGQGHITQSEVIIWLWLSNPLIITDQMLLSDSVIWFFWFGMLEWSDWLDICFILACMDGFTSQVNTPPRTSSFLT